MSGAYREFLAGKMMRVKAAGFIPPTDLLHGYLNDHQAALTPWAIRRGRCAIFAGTGLGKSRMGLGWAHAVTVHTGLPVLILTPLAVGPQMAAEAIAIGLTTTLCRSSEDVRPGINITNYDRLHRFDTSLFGGVVLDESSRIKHHDSKTLALLIEAFAETPYKLCCTATPAPNDWTELGTHAEFLGVCRQQEMLSEFFVHDGGETQTWRLKGHARDPFWRWVASWGVMIQSPADLGFDDSAYRLPPLTIHEHLIPSDFQPSGQLFAVNAQTLSERREARRASLQQRVDACVDVVMTEPKEPWVIWGDLNAETDLLEELIPGAIQVAGTDDIDTKERRLVDFQSGRAQILVSKPSITGFGCNWQHAARMAFVGITDSWEAYYQAVRRIWRFGQKRPVNVHVFASEAEGAVVANLKRKEADALEMSRQLASLVGESVRDEVLGARSYSNVYSARARMAVPAWL